MDPIIDWLNENELRAYPLMDDFDKTVSVDGSSWELPDSFLLDLQLVVNTFELASPDGTSTGIFLKKLKYINQDSLEVHFGSADSSVAMFNLANISATVFPLYVRNPDGNLAVFGDGLLQVIDNFSGTPAEANLSIFVEPSTCIQFNNAWLGVNSLSVSPEKISKSSHLVGTARSYEPALPVYDVTDNTALYGDIKFLEGYNFRVDHSQGAVDLAVSSSGGLRTNCSTSFIPEEYLDCHELVSYINGVPPDSAGTFKLNPGTNIDIVSGNNLASFNDPLTEKANAHTLFVGLTFQTTDLCAPVNVTPLI